jgi:hypothetical protein
MARAKRPAAQPRRRPAPAQTEADRVRHLLALDAALLVRRLRRRRGEMVEAFAKHRERAALVEPLRSWYAGAGFRDLLLLPAAQLRALAAFYEAVDDLRWYFQHTEDMPGTLGRAFQAWCEEIDQAYGRLHAALGVDVGLDPEDAADVVAAAVRAAEARAKERGR